MKYLRAIGVRVFNQIRYTLIYLYSILLGRGLWVTAIISEQISEAPPLFNITYETVYKTRETKEVNLSLRLLLTQEDIEVAYRAIHLAQEICRSRKLRTTPTFIKVGKKKSAEVIRRG